MAIRDLYSKREKRRLRQGQEDVYQYNHFPEALLVQVAQILEDSLGRWVPSSSHFRPSTGWWNDIYQCLRREKGRFILSVNLPNENPMVQCLDFMMAGDTGDTLDTIELAFSVVDNEQRLFDEFTRRQFGITLSASEAIDDLNARFREHGIGFEFVSGEIVRIDSKFIHAEAIKPAIALLHGAGEAFAGPTDEFFSAHAKYRTGDYKDAMNDALKAFESTLKAICTVRGWPFDAKKDAASKLISIVFEKGLVPDYLQNQFTSLRTVLESGTPTVRNKNSGDGQGAAVVDVPAHLARYALNTTASNIVFLMESHNALPN